MKQTIAKIIVTSVLLAAVGFLLWCFYNMFLVVGWYTLWFFLIPLVLVTFIWALGELDG